MGLVFEVFMRVRFRSLYEGVFGACMGVGFRGAGVTGGDTLKRGWLLRRETNFC